MAAIDALNELRPLVDKAFRGVNSLQANMRTKERSAYMTDFHLAAKVQETAEVR